MLFFHVSVVPKTPTLTATPSDAYHESTTQLAFACVTLSTTSGTITYQFFQDSTSVQTGTDATLTLTNPSTANSGSYTCVATIKSVASVASNGHSVTVVGE